MYQTKQEAKKHNEKYYLTGKSCKHGHKSKRYTHNGACYECVRTASSSWYHNLKTDIDKRRYQILKRVEQRARRDGIPFDLTVDDVEWNTHCPVFGYELSYDQADVDRSPSLDKNDPNGGYVKGNVVVMSVRANRAKWNMDASEAKQLYEYFLSQQ